MARVNNLVYFLYEQYICNGKHHINQLNRALILI